MASRIVQYFADKLRTIKDYPITLTKAVYDENGKRLDNELRDMKDNTSDAYSSTKLYEVGNHCIYDNKLYKCRTIITSPEEFDSTKWQQTSCATEFEEISSKLSVWNSYEKIIQQSTITGDGIVIPNIDPNGTYIIIVTSSAVVESFKSVGLNVSGGLIWLVNEKGLDYRRNSDGELLIYTNSSVSVMGNIRTIVIQLGK